MRMFDMRSKVDTMQVFKSDDMFDKRAGIMRMFIFEDDVKILIRFSAVSAN